MTGITLRQFALCTLTLLCGFCVSAQNPFDVTAEAWRCMERQQPDSALMLGRQAVDLFEKQLGKEHPQIGVAYKNLAEMCSQAGRPRDAIRHCLKAMDIEHEAYGEEDETYAELMLGLARYYDEDRQFRKAVEWGERALNYYEDAFPPRLRDLATAQSNLTWYYADTGDYARAISLGKQALQTWTEELAEPHPYIAILHNNLAGYYANLGDFQQALHHDELCMEQVMAYNHTPDTLYAAALSNLASHYSACGQNTRAIEMGQKAVELRRTLQGERHPKYLATLGDLAAIYARINELQEAIRLQTVVVETMQQHGLTHGLPYVRALSNLGMLRAVDGDRTQAIQLTEQALDVARADGISSETALLTGNLALFYGIEKDYDRAIRTSEQTLRWMKKRKETRSPYYGRTLADVAVWYEKKGQTKKAEQQARQAIALYADLYGSDNVADLNTRHNLAQLLADQQRFGEALDVLSPAADKAVALMRQNLTGLSAQQRNNYWHKYSSYLTQQLPRYVVRSGRTDRAGQLYDQSALFSKSLLLNTELEMTRLIFESGDSSLVGQYYEIQTLKADLEKLRALPRDERPADADSLQLDISRREAALAQASKAYGDYCKSLSVSWQEVRDQLREGDLAIEFICFSEDSTLIYAALTLKPDYAQPHLVEVCRDADLLDLHAESYNVNPTERNTQLCHTVWDPLAQELENVQRVYFSPAGRLYQIGIEQLPWDSLSIASDHYDFYRLSSTRELCTRQSQTLADSTQQQHRAMLYGGLAYDIILEDEPRTRDKGVSTKDEGQSTKEETASLDNEQLNRGVVKKLNKHLFKYLKNTQIEVDDITEQLSSHGFDCTLLTNEEGTEQTFKQLGGQGYQLLHIATHGQYIPYDQADRTRQQLNLSFMQTSDNQNIAFDEDVSLTHSMLAMAGANTLLNRLAKLQDSPQAADQALRHAASDGILTASEIGRTDLRGMDLVVLSACQTGLGDVTQEGVMGLQRGFKKAGAQTILMSLWSVDDRATAQLMVQFYKNLLDGQTKRQAFLTAQRKLRQQYASRQNAEQLWGAFILLDALD